MDRERGRLICLLVAELCLWKIPFTHYQRHSLYQSSPPRSLSVVVPDARGREWKENYKPLPNGEDSLNVPIAY